MMTANSFVQRTLKQLAHRLESQGTKAASAYLLQVIRTQPHLADRIYAAALEISPLLAQNALEESHAIDERKAARREKEKSDRERQRGFEAELQRVREEESARLAADFQHAKANGRAIVWGCSLPAHARSQFFSRAEITEIIALRKASASTAATCERLGCTRRELDRWDSDGRLPHSFTRRINPGGKMVTARYWLTSEVDQAKPLLDSWRRQDVTGQGFKQKRKPPTLVE